jgi:hypothetical protein
LIEKLLTPLPPYVSIILKVKAWSQGFSAGVRMVSPFSFCDHAKAPSEPSILILAMLPALILLPEPNEVMVAALPGQSRQMA